MSSAEKFILILPGSIKVRKIDPQDKICPPGLIKKNNAYLTDCKHHLFSDVVTYLPCMAIQVRELKKRVRHSFENITSHLPKTSRWICYFHYCQKRDDCIS